MDLKHKVWQFCQAEGLINSGDTIVAGVSGGPDSVALLHVLCELSKEKGFSVVAAHVHHGLRPEADRELEMVRDLCQGLGVPFYAERVEVMRLAREKKRSVEDAGREERYRVLEEIRQRCGAVSIAVAHHRNDQAETVLMHLIQGTAPHGLQGMLPRRGRVIRPFLDIERSEIMAYLEQQNLPYCIDLSNNDKTYLRNRIRLELIPLLKERFNPAIVDAVARLARIMREENGYWEEQAASKLQEIGEFDANGQVIALDAAALNALPGALQRRILWLVLSGKGRRRISYHDVERVLGLIKARRSGGRVRITGGLWLRREYGRIVIDASKGPAPAAFCYPLVVPGRLEVPEAGITLVTRFLDSADQTRSGTWLFDWDVMEKPLFVRSKRPGDRFRPSGFNGTRKLKDYLIDLKVPRSKRDRIAVLASESEIYWVIGYRTAERGRVGPETKRFLEVEIVKE